MGWSSAEIDKVAKPVNESSELMSSELCSGG